MVNVSHNNYCIQLIKNVITMIENIIYLSIYVQ